MFPDPKLSERRILPLKEVCKRYALGRSTVYRLMDQGRFPRPIQLGPNRVGWRVEDLEAWLESRPAAGEG